MAPGLRRITPIVSKSTASRIASPSGLEDLADIQRGSDHLRDTGQASDAVPAPTLTVEPGDRLDEGSDQASGTAQPFDVHSVEDVRDATRRAQIADDAATDQERHEYR